MREDIARAEARADRPVGRNFLILYMAVGFAAFFLATYTFTVSIVEPSKWLLPDTLGLFMIMDMAGRIESWIGGLLGLFIGYKVGTLR
jgi:hypothetical protein